MRYLCVLAILGTGAAMICLSPDSAEACGRRGYYGGGYGGARFGPAYGSMYYGTSGYAYGYYPSTQYLPLAGTPMYSQPSYGMAPAGQPDGYRAGYTPATATVTASDGAFEPRTLTLQPGTIVQFINRGNNVHTVSDADGRWDSGDIQPGASFSMRFQYPGTYSYLCRYHKDMKATITVSETGSQSNGPPTGAPPSVSPPTPGIRLPADALSNEDAAFLREAASGGMLEIQLGQLAGERAANADVRKFGERRTNDHR